jgi:DnaJ domain
MAADASAYAVLGLEPGADWTAVERAYKNLMKAHHPDRAGGDAGRAAEINRAYRELRQGRASYTWVKPSPMVERRAPSGLWLPAILGLAACFVLMALLTTSLGGIVDDFRMRATPPGTVPPRMPVAAPLDLTTQRLDDGAIRQAVSEAVAFARTGDEAKIANASQLCHRRLHTRPSVKQFDGCVAFDDAIVQLRNRDPFSDIGEFGQVAVTGREMSAGSLLTGDYQAIDYRLDRIRVQVALAIAEAQPEPEPESEPEPGPQPQVNTAD